MTTLFTPIIKSIVNLFKKDKRMLAKGNAFLKGGDFIHAKQCYEAAITLNPMCADSYLNLAFICKEQGEYDIAKNNLLVALTLNPLLDDGFYMLALIYKHESSFDLAIDNFKKAILLNPEFDFAYQDFYGLITALKKEPSLKVFLQEIIAQHPTCAIAHNYLGLVHQNESDIEAAINFYLTSLSINPNNAQVHYFLADLFLQKNRLVNAEKHCRQCLKIDPSYTEGNIMLGEILTKQGLPNQAISLYQVLLKQDPSLSKVWLSLGNIYGQQKKLDAAVNCFERVKELEPDNTGITHLISAFTGMTPEYAPAQYSEKLFDQYAKNFNKNLLEDLQYSAPQRLADLLFQNAFFTSRPMSIMDIGCGTGLVGQLLKPQSKYLVGVDISKNMLAEARKLNIYDRLEHAELLSMMKNETACQYDVITSADVFIYVGKLDDIFREAKRLLVVGGLLAFSVESLDTQEPNASISTSAQPFRLEVSARYAHHSSYIKNLAHSNQFNILKMELGQLRNDHGNPLYAWYVLCEAL